MRKVLVIGCGGSGAKTLSYMMDQLRADLSVHGIHEIPGCWQFVNVDTPIQEEHGTDLPSVGELGGTYVSCGDTGSYSPVDSAVTRRLQAKGTEGLRATATWMPRRPSDVTFPISVGAGQSRAIGRMLTLSKISQVRPGIRRAIDAMNSATAQSQARHAASVLPGAGSAPEAASGAVAIVVSSMAGGSGASMTLDVCRIVSAMPEVDENLTSLFLYTADVFGELPAQDRLGMSGNTLAMLGEIFAAQVTPDGGLAGAQDAELYSLLGETGTAGRPFRRVFPIGRRTGVDSMVFGDGSAEGVYRGMGRGLGRLLLSPRFDSIVQYLIANVTGGNLSSEAVAWGAKADDALWSSFGYASLSMGRDRYAEYASERVARRAVDHVLNGFRQEGSTQGDQQQLEELWQYRRADELRRMGLPALGAGAVMAGANAVDRSAKDWFLSPAGVGDAILKDNAKRAVGDAMRRRPSMDPNMPVAQWAQALEPWSRTEEENVRSALDTVANTLAREFAQRLHDRVLDGLRTAIADHGVIYASFVLDQVAGPGGQIQALIPKVHELAAMGGDRALRITPDFVARHSATKRAVVGQTLGELEDSLSSMLGTSALGWLASAVARRVVALLEDFGPSVATPLQREFEDVRQGLVAATLESPGPQGVAQLASPFYKAWPPEPAPGQPEAGSVPDRFANAHNEVVLMGIDEYVPRFDVDILASVAAEPEGDDGPIRDTHQAAVAARRAVILGRWEKGAGDVPPDDLLVTTRAWVPRGVPGSSAPVAGTYSLRSRSIDLLERSRAFVGRRGESFEVFATESMRSYLTDPAIGEHERGERQKQLLEALRRTLVMAQPLTSIDHRIQEQLGTDPLRLSYEFSSLPFASLDGLVDAFKDEITRSTQISTDTVLSAIDNSLSSLPVSKVDVFGYYPMTFPVAYGLVQDVAEDWKGRSDAGRRDFWHWRRARALPGGLPFSDAERTTMIRGWWVAQLAGGLDIPSNQDDRTPVRIWDPEASEWVAFPAPMLTPPSQMIVSTAWLPIVLESVLLAYLGTRERGLSAFRPWNVLRRWADRGQFEPSTSLDRGTEDSQVVARLLADGDVGTGLPTIVDLTAMTDPEERRAALLAHCDKIADFLDQRFLPGPGKSEDPRAFTNFRHREQVANAPLTVDLAREMREQLLALRDLIAKTAPASAAPTAAGFDDDPVF